MAIVLKAIEHVWHSGRIITPGEVFSAEDAFAKKLIDGGSAKVNNSIEKQLKSQAIGNEELEKSFMALKLDELKDLAIKNKVELTDEDKTKTIITGKLIAAGVVLDEKDV